MNWRQIAPDIHLFEDSCNVYALAAPEGVIVFNAGTGKWLDHLDELPADVRAVVCTHFFRDHSAGAARAAKAGIEVYAPYWEQEQFSDPLGLFQSRETYIIYDNVSGPLFAHRADSRGTLATRLGNPRHRRAQVRIVPTAGVTIGAITAICRLPDGRRAAFCGELIHSPGKLARLAPLQYNYNDLGGAVSLVHSIDLRAPREPRPASAQPRRGHARPRR